MSIIQVKNLTVKRGRKTILSDINWEIGTDENWVLFGLNGCGKTTLLSIIAGYQSAKEGEIWLFDEKLNRENFLELRKKIGFVSSSFFDRYFTTEIVQEIVWAGKFGTLGLIDDISDFDVRKGKELLKELGLKHKMRYPYDCLSKGEKQKVLIARALMAEPEILLLDEPCSGLDIIARERFLHSIQDISEKKNVPIVYVTHHTEEILPFFNKAVLMKDGYFFTQGNLKTTFDDKILSDFFEAKSNVIWRDKHFFINLDLDFHHKNNKSFERGEC